MWYTVTMNVQISGNDLVISGLKDFDLRHIFDCGQCFRWNETGENTYLGVAIGKALKIKQQGDSIILFDTSKEDFENIWYDYFDLGRDYGNAHNYSEIVAAKIDEEIHRILKEAYDRCTEILRAHQSQVDVLTEYLIAHEKIDGDAFDALMKTQIKEDAPC